MKKPFVLVVGFLAATFGISSSVFAEDAKETTKESPSGSTTTTDSKPAKPPYLTFGDVVGEIIKLNNPGQGTGSMTVRVTWYTTTPPKGTNYHSGHWGRGTVARNPQQMI